MKVHIWLLAGSTGCSIAAIIACLAVAQSLYTTINDIHDKIVEEVKVFKVRERELL